MRIHTHSHVYMLLAEVVKKKTVRRFNVYNYPSSFDYISRYHTQFAHLILEKNARNLKIKDTPLTYLQIKALKSVCML